ncbi:MAG: hypothetical protein IPK84_01210 [Candidatus Moraniibacteriota bacterium]|nr:MAG: hypothetical protein IPK84_01210 [Candidatus Moranbacteria bacterium]
MSQINLMSGEGGAANRPSQGFLGGSFSLSVIILVITFAAYFGTVYYVQSLENSLASYKEDLTAKRNLVAGEKANRVADFADRLSVIDENLQNTASVPNDPLSRIERAMMPDVNLSSYSYDVAGGTVKIALVSDSFRAVAQQIVAFKQAADFSAVSVDGNVKIGTDGKIIAELNLSL